MTFFEVGKEAPPQHEFDVRMADLLADELVAARLCLAAPAREAWADQFRLLRKEKSEEEIESLLKWYVRNLRDRWTPKAFSGQAFRRRYIEIKAARERSGTDVEITPEAHLIALTDLRWPGNEKEQELITIQVSLNNYRKFLKDVRDAVDAGRLTPGFADHAHAAGGDVRGFVRHWMDEINRTAWEWSGWQGNLVDYAVSIYSPRFRFVINCWCRSWRGHGDHIEWLLNAIQHED